MPSFHFRGGGWEADLDDEAFPCAPTFCFFFLGGFSGEVQGDRATFDDGGNAVMILLCQCKLWNI